jgi:predicted Zn-ribbon and HTH transcriptional regulator
MNEKVLAAMREAGKPVNVSEVVKISDLEKEVVEKAFKALKKDGSIVSPVRCKWEPAK